jgi:hypothetical protein
MSVLVADSTGLIRRYADLPLGSVAINDFLSRHRECHL